MGFWISAQPPGLHLADGVAVLLDVDLTSSLGAEVRISGIERAACVYMP